jgi:hypothetical protein
MSDDLKIVTVPRELYYHEVAYVRGLEADNKRLRDDNAKLIAVLETIAGAATDKLQALQARSGLANIGADPARAQERKP